METLARFYGSWADIAAQAEDAYGAPGRAVAILTRAMHAGSKGVLAGHIQDAAAALGVGISVDDLLEWAHQPYSSLGLRDTCSSWREWLAKEHNIPLERF